MKMKPITALLAITIAGVTLSADVMPAFASRMNGKCCMSSDGGRSARYRYYMALRAIPHTCSAYAAACVRRSTYQEDHGQACFAARATCMQTGVHVGPYSGIQYAGLERR